MIGLLLGVLAGVGLLIMWSSVRVEPLSGAWDRSPSQWSGVAGLGAPRRGWLTEGVGSALDGSALDDVLSTSGIQSALTISGIDKARFVTESAIKGAASAVGAVVCAGLLGSSSGGMLGIGVVSGALAVAVEVQRLRTRSAERRQEMVIALAAFMEITRLAAQTLSIEGAISVAARAGSTWPFDALRRAMDHSRSLRKPVWDGIVALGHSFAMEELIEVGQVLESAAREGVGVSDSLRSRADVLRRRVTDEAMKSSTARTEQLMLPIAGIGGGVGALLIAGLLMAL